MIRFVRGNLLDSEAEALVNAVNCVGVMGKGIALEFKKRYPEVFQEYARRCRIEEKRPGDVWAIRYYERWIVHAFTKGHWREKSKLTYIVDCARYIALFVKASKLESIAIPALGCGNGGLPWPAVKQILEEALGDVRADVEIYEPR